MNKEKDVILICGNKSKWYEQAIFIVDKNKVLPKNIVLEAEKIINEYVNKKYNQKLTVYSKDNYNNYDNDNINYSKIQPKKVKTNSKINSFLNLTIFCTFGIILCLGYLILK